MLTALDDISFDDHFSAPDLNQHTSQAGKALVKATENGNTRLGLS